MDDDP